MPPEKPQEPVEITVHITKSDQAVHVAPVIYADGAQNFAGNDQVVKFNLFQDRLVGIDGDHAGIPIERVVCARLVMSPLTFKAFVEWAQKNYAIMFPSS